MSFLVSSAVPVNCYSVTRGAAGPIHHYNLVKKVIHIPSHPRVDLSSYIPSKTNLYVLLFLLLQDFGFLLDLFPKKFLGVKFITVSKLLTKYHFCFRQNLFLLGGSALPGIIRWTGFRVYIKNILLFWEKRFLHLSDLVLNSFAMHPHNLCIIIDLMLGSSILLTIIVFWFAGFLAILPPQTSLGKSQFSWQTTCACNKLWQTAMHMNNLIYIDEHTYWHTYKCTCTHRDKLVTHELNKIT